MLTSIRGAVALLAIAAASPALAQESTDAPADVTITGGATLVSDYRFRGISFTAEDAAIQPYITVNHSSGFYVGLWGSNLEDSPVFGEVEVDLIAGYATEITPGATLDVGLTYYVYPDGDSSFGNSDYAEPYVSLRSTFGPATVKLGATYAWSQSAIGNNDSVYVYSDVNIALPDTPITLVGHLGYSNARSHLRAAIRIGRWALMCPSRR